MSETPNADHSAALAEAKAEAARYHEAFIKANARVSELEAELASQET